MCTLSVNIIRGKKNYGLEMAAWLEPCITLKEFRSYHPRAATCNSSSRRSDAPLWPPRAGVTVCKPPALGAGNLMWVLPLQEQSELLTASLAVIHDSGHTVYQREVTEPASVGHVRSETIEGQADEVQTAAGTGCSLCSYSYSENGGHHQRTMRVLVIIALVLGRSSSLFLII